MQVQPSLIQVPSMLQRSLDGAAYYLHNGQEYQAGTACQKEEGSDAVNECQSDVRRYPEGP